MLDRFAFGEVDARFAAGARAGDVAPFLECALVRKKDVGALNGGALGGMAGERVAVLDVLGDVGERYVPGGAVVRPEG
jgi:hypothetical protein